MFLQIGGVFEALMGSFEICSMDYGYGIVRLSLFVRCNPLSNKLWMEKCSLAFSLKSESDGQNQWSTTSSEPLDILTFSYKFVVMPHMWLLLEFFLSCIYDYIVVCLY